MMEDEICVVVQNYDYSKSMGEDVDDADRTTMISGNPLVIEVLSTKICM